MAVSSYQKFSFPTGIEKVILTSCVKELLGRDGLCQTALPSTIPLAQEREGQCTHLNLEEDWSRPTIRSTSD